MSCVVSLLACKYMHVAAPCLLLRHSFGLLAASAAVAGVTWPNVVRRSADHGESHPSLTHMRTETSQQTEQRCRELRVQII